MSADRPDISQGSQVRLRDGERVRRRPELAGRVSRDRTAPVLVLRGLRSESQAARDLQRVTWEPNVRENPEQRVSKKCCVFHKKRAFGESDSSSSDSSDDDDWLSGSPGDVHDAPSLGGALPRDASESAASDSAASADSAPEGSHHHHHHGHGPGCSHHPAPAKRPRCTKEHCYCGTRFA